MKEAKIDLKELSAISINKGPGSFTGLRIGAATVKAFCFANKKPLVSVSSMKIMSEQAIRTNNDFDFYCALVDARGNEIYYSQFDKKNNIITDTRLISVEHKFLEEIYPSASGLGAIAYEKFKNKNFEILENFEPNYIKDFIVNKK